MSNRRGGPGHALGPHDMDPQLAKSAAYWALSVRPVGLSFLLPLGRFRVIAF